MNSKNIGFIGGGNMATSLISGLIASGHSPGQIWVSDLDRDKLESLAANLKVNTTPANDAVLKECEVVVLAVKPQIMHEVSRSIVSDVQNYQNLIVSIAAGVSQASLTQWLGENVAIVRCMPNTPALVMTGATGLHANKKVNNNHKDLAENILRSVGITIWVEHEQEIDAVTAVSGSGPAYFFLLMEAMIETATQLGLTDQTANLLVQQTALGAAKIAMEAADSPGELRRKVTSPGGTTERAIETFQQGGFNELVNKALRAAHSRSIEMSKQSGDA